MTQLKDVIHFYLGCEVEITHPDAAFTRDELDADLLSRLLNDLEPVMQYYKPILRRLEAITDKEKEKVNSFAEFLSDEKSAAEAMANSVKYLLSHQFDLFNLIDTNQAIDKNKITTP